MQHQDRRLPTSEKIKSRILDELRNHRENFEAESFQPYVEFGDLVHIAADGTHADIDSELSEKLEDRTKAVLRRMEKDGLVEHWVSENWHLTKKGLRYR